MRFVFSLMQSGTAYNHPPGFLWPINAGAVSTGVRERSSKTFGSASSTASAQKHEGEQCNEIGQGVEEVLIYLHPMRLKH